MALWFKFPYHSNAKKYWLLKKESRLQLAQVGINLNSTLIMYFLLLGFSWASACVLYVLFVHIKYTLNFPFPFWQSKRGKCMFFKPLSSNLDNSHCYVPGFESSKKQADLEYDDASSKMNATITSVTLFSKWFWTDVPLFSETSPIALKT